MMVNEIMLLFSETGCICLHFCITRYVYRSDDNIYSVRIFALALEVGAWPVVYLTWSVALVFDIKLFLL